MTDTDPIARLGHALARAGRPTSDHDLNAGQGAGAGRAQLRPAGVLIGVQPSPRGARVYLTKRASHLKHHPGQISLPGGKLDPSDADLRACALREAREEIGLMPGAVRILGALDAHETVTGFRVTPFLAEIDPDFRPVREEAEVEEVFTVPFDHLADPQRYRIEGRIWQGARRRYFTVPYGPYYIWGATARILKALADRMAA